MEKYGALMVNGVILIILIIGAWILIDRIGELMNQAAGVEQASKNTLEVMTKALAKVDSMCSGGAGIS